MMRYVRPRTGQRIKLHQRAEKLPEQLFQRLWIANLAAIFPKIVTPDQLDQPHDIVVIDGHTPIHIGFAHAQPGVQQYAPLGIRSDDPQRHIGPPCGRGTEGLLLAASIYDCQCTVMDTTAQNAFE